MDDANEVIMQDNPGFDLINAVERKVVQVTTTNAGKLSAGQFYAKLRQVDKYLPKNYSGTLQIYYKSGSYTSEQVNGLMKKLSDYIKDNSYNIKVKIDPVK